MDPQYERVMQRSDTMKAIRDAGKKVHGFSEALTESLSEVIEKLSTLFGRLSLKDRPCLIGKPATEMTMDEIWSSLAPIDETISKEDTTPKSLSGEVKSKCI